MNYAEDSVFKAHEYEVELTGDQSPTLRHRQKDSMHNRRGAAGESVYIYYEALIRYNQLPNKKKKEDPLNILSFGFGMGYNEILTVLYYLKNNWDLKLLNLFSYEKDLFLYELFNTWLESASGSGSVWDDVYASIIPATAAFGADISKEDVKKVMKELLIDKRWYQGGAVESVADFKFQFDIIYYDAFSSKTDDLVWTEDFLKSLFNTQISPSFVFSTFACTGALRRTAETHGAHFEQRVGYKGKRNATLIYR